MTILRQPDLTLNPSAHMTLLQVGQEQQRVLVVDGVLNHPEQLLEFAYHQSFVKPAPGSYYPGLNAVLPDGYMSNLMANIGPLIASVYALPTSRPLPSFGFFGLATAPSQTPDPLQLIPHIDSPKHNSFAMVHYLGHPSFGGTGLFRHISTGLESIPPSQNYRFNRHMKAELEAHEANPQGLAALYEQIEYIEPIFNRLVLYRANQLHAAVLKNSDALVPDPRVGRLTANLFVNTIQD